MSHKEVRIERTFCDIVINLDLLILVALPDNSTVALGHVAGLPSNVQVMHRRKPLLDVRSGSHFCGAAQQNPHIARAYFGEQCGLFCFGVGVVDELNFVSRQTTHASYADRRKDCFGSDN